MVTQTQLLEVYQELEKRITKIDLRQGGPRGPKGRKGDKGAQGAQGPSGPKGTQGDTGKAGPQGPQGIQGTKGAEGARGPMGPSGRSGVDGTDGRDGTNGLDGRDGVSVTDASIDFDGHLTLQLSDGTFIDAGLIHQNGDGDITYVAGGGIPDSWKKALEGVIEDLEDHIGDFDNPHQVTHAQLPDVGPDDHHPELHTIDSHIDVDLINVELGDGLFYRDGQWINRAAFNESWPTGLGDGGELNIGPGINDIEVLEGLGAVTDNYTNPTSPPVVQGLQWPQINTAITAASPVAGSVVWFTIADTGIPGTPIGNVPINVGELKQYAQPPSPSLARSEIPLGLAIHNGNEWKEVSNPKVLNQAAETLREVATVVLPFSSIVSGGSTRETGTFQVEQDEGTVWENNRNWHVDKADPNRETLPAQSPVSFQYVNRDFSDVEAVTDTFDPDRYDDGSGAPVNVPGGTNSCTIQKLYVDPANNYWVLWGQEWYQNFFAAEANITADLARATVPFILQNSILLGYAVMEKGKNNWDPNEAVWIPAGGAAGGSGGGGTPITDHNNLNGIGPNDHHNQQHLLYGPDHTDVNSAVPMEQQQGLFWDGVDTFDPEYRTQGKEYSVGATYFPQDMVFQDGYLSIANTVTTDYPSPVAAGEEEYLYEGTEPTTAGIAKQIIFGTRYTFPNQAFYIEGYRVWTVTGNNYTIYSIVDPDGENIITEISTITGNAPGWQEFGLAPTLVLPGTVFELLVVVTEPDPTPTTFTGNWNYTTPNNPDTPGAGVIIQANQAPAEFRINKTDNDAVDRTADLATLTVGDVIEFGVGETRWAIQGITDNGTWYTFLVSPAVQESPDGVNNFAFETVTPTPITYMSDTDYWLTSPYNGLAEGRLKIDDNPGIINNTAYGTDLLIQRINQSPDWDLFGLPGGAGGGGGGDFTPDIFAGAGTTGYVPDPVTEEWKVPTGRWYLDRHHRRWNILNYYTK